ncbi:MAG: HAD-IA family hydrolase [Anaerolineae bacterium]|nr:HAD-IA family hydrolase [Anaerolineae bacterium]
MMAIRAVIFDRDGVLTYFDMKTVVKELGALLPISIEALTQRWWQWSDAHPLPNNVTQEHVLFSGFWNHLSHELELTQEQREYLHQFNYNIIFQPFPDARPAMIEIKQQGLSIGVLSNFELASIDDSLVAAGLSDLVDVAYTAPVIGVAKPEPEAYLTITQALAVQPGECLFFDDEEPAIKGARAVGIQHSYLVDRERTTHAPDKGIVKDLSILPDLLKITL